VGEGVRQRRLPWRAATQSRARGRTCGAFYRQRAVCGRVRRLSLEASEGREKGGRLRQHGMHGRRAVRRGPAWTRETDDTQRGAGSKALRLRAASGAWPRDTWIGRGPDAEGRRCATWRRRCAGVRVRRHSGRRLLLFHVPLFDCENLQNFELKCTRS
jgi:hypothetical protein